MIVAGTNYIILLGMRFLVQFFGLRVGDRKKFGLRDRISGFQNYYGRGCNKNIIISYVLCYIMQ